MENELLAARIDDIVNICEKTSKPKFLGFLSEEEAVFAKRILSKRRTAFDFDGGYNEAKRVILGCFPDWCDNFVFPIKAITFTFRKTDVLRHRDFLGALMSLGIKRETVGDILVEEGRSVVFVTDDIADFVLSQVEKIGRTGVRSSLGFYLPLPSSDTLTEHTVTIASERLDCVVAALAKVSRSYACEMIESGIISVNSVVCQKATYKTEKTDIITIRGKGKYIIDSVTNKTKKNRIVLIYKKYT